MIALQSRSSVQEAFSSCFWAFIVNKSLAFPSICFYNIKKSSFNPSMSATIFWIWSFLTTIFGLSSMIDSRLLRSWLLFASRNVVGLLAHLKPKNQGVANPLLFPASFVLDPLTYPLKKDHRDTENSGFVVSFYINLELLICWVFPPGVSHFPCFLKTSSTKFSSDSRSFVYNNSWPFR